MRKYGSNKKNPNPPWPNNESVIVVPPGSGARAIGIMNENLRDAPTVRQSESEYESRGTYSVEGQTDNRTTPIMGNMYPASRMTSGMGNQMVNNSRNTCSNMGVSSYLCDQIGKYVKLEFLFGENTHMEKLGRLRSVGKDFVAIQENGTNTIIVCSVNKIKFINIYEYNI